MMTPVTAVIPNWNRAPLLESLLEGLHRQSFPAARTIVVDGGSTDGSQDAARRHGAELLALDSNRGFAYAVNRGIEASATPLTAILNNDVELEPDYLRHLAAGLAAHPEAWFATGKIFQAGQPGTLDASFDAISRAACPWRCGHGRPDGPDYAAPREIQMAPFTALLARRDLFTRIGMLDERFESYLEDADFGMRCAAAGLPGRFVPQAVARHWGSATLGVWNSETVRLMARNQLFLVAKHFPKDWPLRLGWPVLAGQLLWGFVAARHGRAGPWIGGKWEGIRRFRSLRPARLLDDTGSLGEFLEASEGLIRDLQRPDGLDWYWKAYFAIV
jgi:hypothetical protein